MTNFSIDSGVCRVEVFKATAQGVPVKWYMTEAVQMEQYYHDVDGVERAILEHFNVRGAGRRASGMVAVCFDPYSEFAYPRVVRL